MTLNISAVGPILVSKSLFQGEFECFISFLSIWGPKNNFSPPKKFDSHQVSLSLNFDTRKLVLTKRIESGNRNHDVLTSGPVLAKY